MSWFPSLRSELKPRFAAAQFRRRLALFAVVTALGLARSSAAEVVGHPLPDLAGFSLVGPLPDFRGHVVLLDFWASWCAPCKASFPAMADLHRQFADRGLVIFAVSVDDDAAACARFVAQTHAPFAVVRDASHKLVAAVDARTMPTSLLIDRHGVVRYVHEGFHGRATIEAYRQQIAQLLAESTP